MTRERAPPGDLDLHLDDHHHENKEERMNLLQRRVAAIEALPEADRERLRELMHRGDVLNGCVQELEDAPPIPDRETREEQLELLRAERDAAWAAANRLEAALGLSEPW
jgi:hypothetical protein